MGRDNDPDIDEANFQGPELQYASGEELVFQEYCMQFAATAAGQGEALERTKPTCLNGEPEQSSLTPPIRRELQKELGLHGRRHAKVCSAMVRNQSAVCSRWVTDTEAGDSDGEVLHLCSQCRLPLAEKFFKEKGKRLHAECLAQHWVSDMQEKEMARKQLVSEQKQSLRQEYDIGWKTHHIPRNDDAASKLVMENVNQGMVCLEFQESDMAVQIAATSEPAAAVNLEYLSLALQCRRFDGHEPYFSLNPMDPSNRNSMQEKYFEPAWLAGTSAGEVLFQADYHLKELSMGECEQPVVGMRSCLDYDDQDEAEDWNAREWFLVKKAEVWLSDSNVLVPFVKMGVEAREQVVKCDVLEDSPITRSSHPMVKYADAFTHNFDLIAERKSVIYNLRELAKASVLAKFMFEVGMELEQCWFSLGQELACSMEVPQLWNERMSSQVLVQSGSVVREKKGLHSRGIYGGVAFGLDKFTLGSAVMSAVGALPTARVPAMSAVSALLTRQQGFATPVGLSLGVNIPRIRDPGVPGKSFKPPLTGVSLSPQQPRQVVVPKEGRPVPASAQAAAPVPARARRRPRPAGAATAIAPLPGSKVVAARPSRLKQGWPRRDDEKKLLLPERVQEAPTAREFIQSSFVAPILTLPPRLQGADLRLDQFDLSVPKKISLDAEGKEEGGQIYKPLEDCAAMGEHFWASLDDDAHVFAESDRQLLKNVFNPALSDRRSEGDCFTPPDASSHYVEKLKSLVKEEQAVQNHRKDHFLSKEFSVNDPGPVFPLAWRRAFEVVHHEASGAPPQKGMHSDLQPRPGFAALGLWQHVLETAAADFDKTTEDGHRFRIYKLGSLEIRTTQDPDGREIVGAVFSVRSETKVKAKERAKKQTIGSYDVVSKVTEYVEAGGPDVTGDGAKDKIGDQGLFRHYYIVIETEAGHRIVTEKLASGQTTWQENPDDLDDRNSLAKVLCSADCKSGVIVRDMKTYQEGEVFTAPSQSACKWYARGAYSRACGEVDVLRQSYRQAITMKRAAGNSPLLVDAPCID